MIGTISRRECAYLYVCRRRVAGKHARSRLIGVRVAHRGQPGMTTGAVSSMAINKGWARPNNGTGGACDVHGQRKFDEIAGKVTGFSPSAALLLLDCDLRIRAASTPYERVTLREHNELVGQFLFDAFPDDPNDPQASGTSNLAASLETSMRSGRIHNMWVQRYDVRHPASPDTFLPKVWRPTNAPLFDHGELVGAIHRVEEISNLSGLLAVLARALDSGESWSSAELLHTLAAVSAVENTGHRERHQALVAENTQLRRAIDTRDTIGQAKGILMERFAVDAVAAFDLLVNLSQNTNTAVARLACKLIEAEHPQRAD